MADGIEGVGNETSEKINKPQNNIEGGKVNSGAKKEVLSETNKEIISIFVNGIVEQFKDKKGEFEFSLSGSEIQFNPEGNNFKDDVVIGEVVLSVLKKAGIPLVDFVKMLNENLKEVQWLAEEMPFYHKLEGEETLSQIIKKYSIFDWGKGLDEKIKEILELNPHITDVNSIPDGNYDKIKIY